MPETIRADKMDATACVAMSAERINRSCICVTLDKEALKRAIAAEVASAPLRELIAQRMPTLFSEMPVFISDSQFRRMERTIQAVQAVVALPRYREQILAQAPEVARHDPRGAAGVFFGYDFHVNGEQIGLIEINTNAGGAMLNAVLARAHQTCCLDAERRERMEAAAAGLDARIIEMFRQEWDLANPGRALHTIAIVDENPTQQYLYPEFLMFQALFERHGLHAMIADPAELIWENGSLRCHGVAIDLVYNRLTDFMLTSSACANLRSAYLADAIVLTPHPRAHVLYANKSRLALLTCAASLQALDVPAPLKADLFEGIPLTRIVTQQNADQFWRERRQWFFKPMEGYGSRAAYRGDKLTRRVWDEIMAGGYVAQAIVVPGARAGGSTDAPLSLKYDIRCYVYDGKVQWMAARLYQGQTTNFRTVGGGFAPVYTLPDADIAQEGPGLLRSAAAALACRGNQCN